jgi:hypothetical protein
VALAGKRLAAAVPPAGASFHCCSDQKHHNTVRQAFKGSHHQGQVCIQQLVVVAERVCSPVCVQLRLHGALPGRPQCLLSRGTPLVSTAAEAGAGLAAAAAAAAAAQARTTLHCKQETSWFCILPAQHNTGFSTVQHMCTQCWPFAAMRPRQQQWQNVVHTIAKGERTSPSSPRPLASSKIDGACSPLRRAHRSATPWLVGLAPCSCGCCAVQRDADTQC